jgi:transposase
LQHASGWADNVGMDTPRSTRPAFSRVDRRRLVQALAQAHEARLYRRLRAVAEVAEGEPVAAVARRARVARSTVYRWITRYLAERAPSALVDGERPGRPRAAAALTEDRLRQRLTSDPRQFGYNANTWTVPLLAAHLRAQGLAISARTLRRRIRAARFRWKRPRYVDSERAEHVGANKGGWSDG